MSADAAFISVGPDNHRHGVPSKQTFNPMFNFSAAGIRRLILRAYGVQVWRCGFVVGHNFTGLHRFLLSAAARPQFWQKNSGFLISAL
jgi:hypothetical protein